MRLDFHTVHADHDAAPQDHSQPQPTHPGRTSHAVGHGLILLTMGMMMPETCWDRSLIINIELVASCWFLYLRLNPLTPNDHYSGRTAPLTSKRCILYIYSTNTGTEYFKHGIHSPFIYLQNAVCFINLTCLVPVLFTFYIQSVLE